MPTAKPPSSAKKRVWRVSPGVPQGEWVDPSRTVAPSPALAVPEVGSGSWVTSSFDLLNGTDVVEFPGTMTPEQFNELFKPSGGGSKGPVK